MAFWPPREDFAIPVCCQTGPEILDEVRKHYSQWKSNQEAEP